MANEVDVLTMYVAGKIEEQRDRVGITQDDLSLKAGVSRPTIVNMEHGRQGVSIKRLFDIANVLDCEISELLPTKEWYAKNKGKKLRKVISYEIIE